MERASGTHLKARYSSLLPATLDGDAHALHSAFHLRSDDSERTLQARTCAPARLHRLHRLHRLAPWQSGAALFSGMYPNATAPYSAAAIVPMHVVLAESLGGVGDSMMPSATVCEPQLDPNLHLAAA